MAKKKKKKKTARAARRKTAKTKKTASRKASARPATKAGRSAKPSKNKHARPSRGTVSSAPRPQRIFIRVRQGRIVVTPQVLRLRTDVESHRIIFRREIPDAGVNLDFRPKALNGRPEIHIARDQQEDGQSIVGPEHERGRFSYRVISTSLLVSPLDIVVAGDPEIIVD